MAYGDSFQGKSRKQAAANPPKKKVTPKPQLKKTVAAKKRGK